MSTVEDWVQVGAEVASVRLGQRKSVTFSKINRIGKAWLFLDNGEKFHKLGLDRQEGGNIGGTSYRLFPADSSKVQEYLLDIEVKKIMESSVRLAEKFAKDPDVEIATSLVEALIHFTPYKLVPLD